MNKLPKVNTYFWIMKLAATTLGETGGDLLAMTLALDYAGSAVVFGGFFVISLLAQLASKTYRPVIFWSVIVTTTLTGAAIADLMSRGTDQNRTLGLGYPITTAILLALLLAILGTWYLSERSLAVERIRSLRAETFYWVAILVSNTLGTAAGDFLATSSGLGFTGANVLITGVLVLVLFATLFTNISRVPLFWIAFVLTRPYGATFGDVLTKSPAEGGTGFGTVGASLVMGAILAIFIVYTTLNKDKVVEANIAPDVRRTARSQRQGDRSMDCESCDTNWSEYHAVNPALTAFIETYGLVAVFVFVGIESLGIPFPGETMLVTAGIYAGTTHQLSIPLVVTAAAVGAIFGVNIGFGIGHCGGYRLPVCYGKYVRLDQRKLKLGRYIFLRHGGKVVFFGGFVSILRTYAAFLAGTNRMRWWRLLVFNAAGGIVWAALYRFGAYYLGQEIERVRGPVGIAIAVTAVVVTIAFLIFVRRSEAGLEDKAERVFPGPLEGFPGGRSL